MLKQAIYDEFVKLGEFGESDLVLSEKKAREH